jgi:hypothetical protein
MPDIKELKIKYADLLDLIDNDINVPNGWYEIIDNCLHSLNVLKYDFAQFYAPLKVRQIKLKYGTLRIYVDCDPDNVVDAIIKDAIEKSETTCMDCGSPAAKIRAYSVRCRSCRMKFNKENK